MNTLPALLASAITGESHTIFESMLQWAKVEDAWGLALVIFGLAAQATFFGRWIVQWVATERKGESHVPELFWWMSLAGATMLFAYFWLRHEPIGLIGQSIGWTVYSRNLWLIRKKRKQESVGDFAPEDTHDSEPAP